MARREVHNERFKAWVYTVINPVLEGLRIESGFLQKGNWTFRFHSGELEFVRPVAAYVEFPSQPNLEDFLESNPEDKRIMASRDQSREALRAKCQEALAFLTGQGTFRQKVSSCAEQFKGDFQTEVADKLVAELIVNNIRSQPEHYRTFRFWSRYGEELMAFRTGEIFQQADRAGEQLAENNKQVSARLRETRKQLAEAHDVPFAPYQNSLAR